MEFHRDESLCIGQINCILGLKPQYVNLIQHNVFAYCLGIAICSASAYPSNVIHGTKIPTTSFGQPITIKISIVIDLYLLKN